MANRSNWIENLKDVDLKCDKAADHVKETLAATLDVSTSVSAAMTENKVDLLSKSLQELENRIKWALPIYLEEALRIYAVGHAHLEELTGSKQTNTYIVCANAALRLNSDKMKNE